MANQVMTTSEKASYDLTVQEFQTLKALFEKVIRSEGKIVLEGATPGLNMVTNDGKVFINLIDKASGNIAGLIGIGGNSEILIARKDHATGQRVAELLIDVNGNVKNPTFNTASMADDTLVPL